MGFFGSLLSGITGGNNITDGENGDLVSCRSCGEMVDEDTVDGAGDCEDCSEEEYDKYCCGRIYEDGETTCSSCGDPL
ncbi:hypothetical protein ABY45_16325 [Microbacterium maritypicum]|uniref:hypothetical protein n=1 Tax=Microbacterium maritypicum TaxID=33918 RepID=UPI003D700C6F